MVDATAEIIISVGSVIGGLEVESIAFRLRFAVPFPGNLGFFSSKVVFEVAVFVLAVCGLNEF